MLRKSLLSMLLALSFGGNHLGAQSYQTSFSDVKFDRANGPSTFHSGVEIDAASGAASMSIPFGPGIGERGLKFRPLLSLRIGPQLRISTTDENLITGYWFGNPANPMVQVQTVDSLYQSSFGSASFSPGTIDLASMVTTQDRKKTTYSLPSGNGGRGLVGAGTTISSTEVQATLLKFGFSANDTVGFRPGPVGTRTKASSIDIGSDGHLIVGLRAGGLEDPITHTTDEVVADIQDMPSSQYRWDFPRRMVVLQENTAYEYQYVNHNYTTKVIPYLAISQKTQLNSAHYVLVKIRNRFGESIEFIYDADGIGYKATWKASPTATSGPTVRVEVIGNIPAPSGTMTLLRDSYSQITTMTQIRVSYSGISQATPTYLLELADPGSGAGLDTPKCGGPTSVGATSKAGQFASDLTIWNAAVQSVQPIRVLQVASDEEIKFEYAAGPAQGWSTGIATPTVLSGVSFPNRRIDLTWEPYPFRMNYSPEAWGGATSSSAPRRPAYGYGVTRVSERDTSASKWITRETRHRRVVPTSNWITSLDISPWDLGTDQWVDTAFYDAITHPDGTISVHRFYEPTVVNDNSLANLAFIKAIEREVRYYKSFPGITDWQADLSVTNPASSLADSWVVKDRLDVRTIGVNPVPFPTRVRTWDKESQILTIEETTDWDGAAFGWKTSHRTSAITPSPSLSEDVLSLAIQGLGYSNYPATQGIHRTTDKSFEPKISEWILARVKTEQTTTLEDNTGFLASDVTFPDAQPLVTKTFHPDVNRVEAVGLSNSGAPTVTTSFTFQGTSGLAANKLLSAYLTSPGLGLSGQQGVSAYGYDDLGYMNSISQKPRADMTLMVGQSSDELGRPVTQTDMNGTVRTFGWDLAGRLTSITSSDLDEGTTITYNDTDHRGVTVTHGAQVSEYRYNGFGQLILERRKSPDGTWSFRIHGYDSAGRKTGETVWQPGNGTAHEEDWSNYNLVRSTTSTTTTTTPETTICKKWGLDADGNAVCITWQTIPASTTTNQSTINALYPGQATQYDSKGRVIWTQDANGVPTTTEYFGPGNMPAFTSGYVGPIQRVTLGAGSSSAQVKLFESDASGRMVRVTTPVTRYADPLKSTNTSINVLRSEYRYDGGDRIKEVKQFDDAARVQTRTWGYNRLGWLASATTTAASMRPTSGVGNAMLSTGINGLQYVNGDISGKQLSAEVTVSTTLLLVGKVIGAEASALGTIIWEGAKAMDKMVDDSARCFDFGFNPMPH